MRKLWHSPRLSAYRQLLKDKGFALQALQAAGPKALAQMPEDFWQERLGREAGRDGSWNVLVAYDAREACKC